jgi:NAD(P)-dependent dehydrogenase (short-subunit alcohol dehydrogenase family)
MDLELRGKKVLITGASKGIGLACAHAFAAEGAARVHIASRSESALQAASDAIRAKNKTDVSIHAADLGVTQNAVALGEACADVDILVNNAGAIPQGSLTQLSDEKWRRGWELKVFGFVNLTREIYKRMCERGSGVIVNVIGVAGERHRSNYIAGTSGNAALIAFTRALGSESVDHGVRVVGVNPGRILTERQIDHMQDQAEKDFGDRNRWKEILAQVSETLPFKRTGDPSEVADLVAFLASARAAYISGTVITIDAGQSLRPRS